MKKVLLILIVFCFVSAQAVERKEKALVLAVFGTSTEAVVTFEELLPYLDKGHSDRDIFMPFTSGVIRNKLNKNLLADQKILSPEEMLQLLKDRGYKDIVIATTILFEGVEHDKLKNSIENFSAANPSIMVKYIPPLLSEKRFLPSIVATLGKYLVNDGFNVVVSHGTHEGHPVEQVYKDVKDEIQRQYPNTQLASVEGYPSLDDVMQDVQRSEYTDVRFVVFMFVAGDHAENDIEGDDGDSMFSTVKSMGKTPSIVKVKTSKGLKIASLGLDKDYRRILLYHIDSNMRK